jgi:hypothetical protein
MKSTTLIQLIALPTTLAFVQLNIVVKEGVEGYKVAAKGEEAEFWVTGANAYEDEGLMCMDSSHGWTSECQDGTKHRKLGESHFTDVPEGPQPFTVAIQQPQDQKDRGIQSVSYPLSCIAYTDTKV